MWMPVKCQGLRDYFLNRFYTESKKVFQIFFWVCLACRHCGEQWIARHRKATKEQNRCQKTMPFVGLNVLHLRATTLMAVIFCYTVCTHLPSHFCVVAFWSTILKSTIVLSLSLLPSDSLYFSICHRLPYFLKRVTCGSQLWPRSFSMHWYVVCHTE